MSHYQPLGRRVVTLPFVFLGVIALIGLYFLAERFINGMGAVTNLNGGFPWGIWVVYDIVVGTALACGGYALAVTVYVFNKGKYHPLIRPALLASLLGYGLGGVGAIIDMGRWWQFYNLFLPWQMNFNSVMLEVGLCVSAYIVVLMIEFLPTVLEKFKAEALLKKLNKVLFVVIALGVLLPTMHQSSLGTMLIAMGWKVHPLWQTLHLQPLLAVLTAFTMGFSIVVFEGSLSSVGFRRKPETHLLSGLGRIIVGLIAVYLAIRFGEILVRGKLGLVFAGDLASLMFLIETALFVYPLVVLMSPRGRGNARSLLFAAVSMLLAGTLYRFNAFLITLDPGPGYSYFPALPEIMVTVGLVAIEIMVFLFVVKTFPVMPREDHAAAPNA
ncbi:MAG TPA: Ni/Fe-hydrogenase cytochrome b subunit [Gammaproteobacteria bacterium]|nr:Ni/Fe-hydrogenase cytochrome b subunit [Gammaproteobacteria bacterium]